MKDRKIHRYDPPEELSMSNSTELVKGIIERSKHKFANLRKEHDDVPRPKDLIKSIDYLLLKNEQF